ncbi:MAG: Type I phosphodiesterase / nucleotide pyrophosphatase [bacterium ADurb.Bin236]|nr:MAG: Type I phosphodiesterase / nucleotide pyrophosphatase [bacterium ADurb.Bin236]HOY64044.1 alkaline phosphatase family protein [bacterium]HPN96099.1 alkaline phosphatase family protein [bacterium]
MRVETRAAMFTIGAMRPGVFYELLDDGRLPNIEKIFSNAVRAELAAAVFPSVAASCHAALATGAMPGRNLITGGGRFDRHGKMPAHREYAMTEPWRGAAGRLGLPALPKTGDGPALDKDISGGTATIFEALKTRAARSAAVWTPVGRGADEHITASALEIALASAGGKGGRAAFDRAAARKAAKFIADTRRLHRMIQVNFAGAFPRSADAAEDEEREYISGVLDACFGRTLDALARRHPLEEFHFTLCAARGGRHAPASPERVVSRAAMRRILSSAGYSIYNPAESDNPKRRSAVAFIHSGSYHLHLRNRATGKWHSPPLFEEDLMAAADAFFGASASGSGGAAPGWLDLALVKNVEMGEYMVYDGVLAESPEDFFSRSGNETKYPGASKRLKGFFCKHSPDVVLLADRGKGFCFEVENGARGGGGLCAEDSLVPLLFSGPGVESGMIRGMCSIIDTAPTVAALFDVSMTTADGRILPLFKRD